ncbi:MAG: MBL fold metallo-hydrolase [Deltaproteobacteria bacterium]|nr:MBL fold metallo-hydrolase [Deltaproteobacteria bacterium]
MRTTSLLSLSFLSLSLASLSLTVGGCANTEPPAAAASNASVTSRSASSLETFTSGTSGFDTHSFWVDTGREVVVFDAQFTPDLAKEVIARVREKTQSPIKWLVVTHPNPDKFNGAPAFQAIGAKVVASKSTAAAIPGVHAYKKGYFVNVAKSFTEATYPAQASIDVTFDKSFSLPLEGDLSIELRELAHRGVSSTQTVAIVPRLDAVVVGDLVHHQTHAWLEGGIVDGKATPDLASWKSALGELLALGVGTVYGGRGPAAKVDEAVAEEKAYLDGMNALVTKYVAELGPRKSELDGPNAGAHYKEIAARAAAAFPGYAHPYLVEYGAYGLVSQVAAGARSK